MSLYAGLQVLEILSHVNKRVRGHEHIKLPLDALLDLYLLDTSAPLVKNFAIVYVEMAMDRCSPEQQLKAVSHVMLPELLITCKEGMQKCHLVLHRSQLNGFAPFKPARPET